MKQKIVPGIFRRRGKSSASASASAKAHRDAKVDGSCLPKNNSADANDDFPSSLGRINIVPSSSSHRVIDITSGRSDSVRTNQVLHDDDDGSVGRYEAAYGTGGVGLNDLHAMGIDHLSLREQMWYKNQVYLLEKQHREQQKSYNSPPRRTSDDKHQNSRYESNDDHHRSEANRGVDDFESANGSSRKKEVQFRSSSKIQPDQDDHENDTLFDETDTRTTQSSSLFDEDTTLFDESTRYTNDNTRNTNQSSSLFHDEDDASESNFDEVTLESTTLGDTLTENNEGEEVSYLTSLGPDDGTASNMSYVFQLLDEDKYKKQIHKQNKKFQSGVGGQRKLCNGKTSKQKKASGQRKAAPVIKDRVTVHSPRGGRRRSKEESNDDIVCPILPAIMEEVSGTYVDAKLALDQVLHAFFISPDDIDRVADKLHGAKLELVDMYHDSVEERERLLFA